MFWRLCAILAFALVSAPAARAQSLTIQGKVLDASNNPITGTAVQFRVQIKAPDAAKCVLYDETQTLNLSSTSGLFSLSLNDGSGTPNTPTTYGLEAAVSNRVDFAVNSSYCASGSGVVTYHPGDTDNRKIVISFYDPGSMSGFEQIPEMDLNPMAFAMESRTVGGYPASSLLRVVTAGAPGAAPTLSAASAAELEALGAGTSTKYTPASATNGAQIPSFSSDPTSPPAGSIWYNSTSGELHYRTSGGTQVVGAGGGGGGTITAITVGRGLSGGGSSGSVAVSLPSGTANDFLKYDGANWAGAVLGFSDLKNASSTSAVGSAVCTAGQTMYYDTTAKELKCQSIGLANADVSGTLGVAHGGTGLTAGTVGAIPYFSSTSALSLLAAGSNGDVLTMNGSGVPVWQSLPASSFSGSGTTNRLAKFTGASAVGNSILTDDGTNVGVGTTAPIARLEVAGSLRLADGGESCSAGANVGMMKYSGGSLFFCNASGWQTLGVSGAGLTSLNGLTTNTQTFAIGSSGTAPAWSSAGSVHTLNLPTASASNSGILSSTDWSSFNGKLDGAATFAGDVTGTYNANVVTKLRGVAIGTTAPAAGQALKYVGSAWTAANLGFGDLKTTGGAATMASAVCNAGQTMYYDSTTGDLKCQSVDLANASVTGTVAVANGGTGASTTSQNYVFAGPISGSGAPSFRQLTAADISGLNTYWTSATGGINYAGGNVGIGTTAPDQGLVVRTTGNSIIKVNAYSGTSANLTLASDAYTSVASPTSDFGISVGGTERIRIQAGGSVGIGSASPTARLDIAGSVRIADGGETCSAGTNVGMMKYSGGSLYYCNASGWQTLGVSGAGLTSLNGLTGNTQTFAIGSAGTSPAWSSSGTTHTLNLPTASASNSGILSSADWSTFNGKLGASATFAGDVTGTYNANVVTKLQGVAIGTTAPSSGQFLKFTTSWNPASVTFGDVKTTGGSATMASAVCNAGQTMYYDSTAGDLKCQSIALGNASITGTLAVANGGTGATSTSQNYVFAGPTSGSGAPSFRALTTADISGLNTYWASATGGINYAGGNVGIGIASPVQRLHLNDSGANSVMEFFTNSATGATLTDGSYVGINGAGNMYVWNQENLPILFGTNNGERMRIDGAGNVGIGTSSPQVSLDVPGKVALASSAYPNSAYVQGRIFLGGGGTYGAPASSGTSQGSASVRVAADGGAALDTGFLTGGSAWLQATNVTNLSTNYPLLFNPNGGNVGIGTTSPAARLHVVTTASSTTPIGMDCASGYCQGSATSNAKTMTWGVSDAAPDSGAAGAGAYVGSHTSDPLYLRTGAFTRMSILTNGNVGIGTSAPVGKLQVAGGSIVMDNATLFQAKNASGTVDTAIIPRWTDNAMYLDGNSAIYLRTNNGSTTGLKVDASGWVGIGGITPSSNLDVQGTGSFGVTIRHSTFPGTQWKIGPYSGSNNFYIIDEASQGMYLTKGSGASGWNVNSDRRLKQDIQPLAESDGLAAILKLRPVTYQWRDVGASPARQTGFIAQEVREILPSLVSTSRDIPVRLPDGSTEVVPQALGVNYTGFVIPLVKAVQQMQREIDGLKSECRGWSEMETRLRSMTALTTPPETARELASMKQRLDQAERENADLKARVERLEKLLK